MKKNVGKYFIYKDNSYGNDDEVWDIFFKVLEVVDSSYYKVLSIQKTAYNVYEAKIDTSTSSGFHKEISKKEFMVAYDNFLKEYENCMK
jgi:hypothetical protein